MKERLHYAQVAQDGYKSSLGLEQYLRQCGLEEALLHLVKLRASQVNGCAYCLDVHWKDLRAIGENEQRLYSLDAWRECPYYTDRERAALSWTEAVTLVTNGHVPDSVYEQVRPHFTEKELSDLTLAVATINAWNRLAIAGRTVPGTYRLPSPSRSRKGHSDPPSGCRRIREIANPTEARRNVGVMAGVCSPSPRRSVGIRQRPQYRPLELTSAGVPPIAPS